MKNPFSAIHDAIYRRYINSHKRRAHCTECHHPGQRACVSCHCKWDNHFIAVKECIDSALWLAIFFAVAFFSASSVIRELSKLPLSAFSRSAIYIPFLITGLINSIFVYCNENDVEPFRAFTQGKAANVVFCIAVLTCLLATVFGPCVASIVAMVYNGAQLGLATELSVRALPFPSALFAVGLGFTALFLDSLWFDFKQLRETIAKDQ